MSGMLEYLSMKRFLYDFLAYLVFLGSAYVMFATSWAFRFVLIPVTLFAFFNFIVRAYQDALEASSRAAAMYLWEKDKAEKSGEEESS